ncbi:hypothetical protein G5C51_19485 [Streptomyces sp. A7024]|uniref:Secreted protein n=1 Tax=Streptomyces coryli TaxID=1128680 RepID=A0A6G4U3X3_9ACTN|nr:hypothetical protein [Streptomyces coryli]NGN66068.1 hypothetical protein [Streptomyces coryli]
MAAVLPYLLLSGGFAVVLCGFAWLGRRIRRRGVGGAAAAAGFAAWEEAFRTTSHAAYVEVQQQSKRKAPLESPDGDPRRRLRIRLRQPR